MKTNLSHWFKCLPFGTLNKIFGIDLNVMPEGEVEETLNNCDTFWQSLTAQEQGEIYTNYDLRQVLKREIVATMGQRVN